MTNKSNIKLQTLTLQNLEYFTPTMRLRWRRSDKTTTLPDMLEQAWQGSAGTIRWEDIPLEIVPDER